ncbi:T6SS effector BTH_I2691 family protein [Luteimonas sp. A277]
MTDAQTQQEHCPNCTKFGLPILPLRYAVARNDEKVKEKAPELADPFGDGVRDIALPDESARYTLRLLRSGYLYVFNEVRGEWKAYEIGEDSQLIEFDIRDKAPPPQTDEDELPAVCSRHGNPPMTKCVVIPDAANAGPVWFAFSDVAWTPAVLEHNRVQANREKHMRRIDVGAWTVSRGGAMQSHIESLSALAERVAEYHFESPAAQPNTPEEIAGHEAAQAALPESERSTLLQSVSIKPYPAFFHCLEGFANCSSEAEQLIADAQRAGERWGYPPAMVALNDPVGIATDLNELAKERAREWAEAPERKQKHESALLIGAVRQAVENGAEASTSEARRNFVGILGALMPAHAGTYYGGQPGITGVVRGMERAGRIDESELELIHARAWEKYEPMYDEAARRRYLEEEYPAALAAFEESTIKPLDEAYIAWMDGEPFREYFKCNFDRGHVQSGLVYTGVLYTVLVDAAGRKTVCDYLERCFDADPNDPGSVLVRGLVFNQDELARQWVEMADVGVEPYGGWDGMANRLWNGINGLLGQVTANVVQAAKTGLSNYAHEYSAVLVRKFKRVYDLRTGNLIAGSVEVRAVTVLGAVAKAKSPDYRMVTVRSETTRMQALRIVSHATEAVLDPRRRPSGSSNEIRNLFDPGGGRVTFQGVLLMESTQRMEARGTLRLTPEQFDLCAQSGVRTAMRLEAGGHFVGALLAAWTLSSAWDEMKRAPSSRVAWGFAAGVAALSGSLMEGAGSALRRSGWGSTPLSKSLSLRSGEAMTRARLLGYVGRLIGGLGGVISGLLAIDEGYRNLQISPWYGRTMIALGMGMMTVGVLLAIGKLGGVVGLVVALVVALVILVVGFLKKDDIQKWLDKTIDFGRHKAGEFAEIAMQWDAMIALASEGEQ